MPRLGEHELSLTRIFDAPPNKVYRAWTDPDLLKEWFTPRPYTVSDVEMDLRSGGVFNVTMRGPDGEVYPNNGIFLEVVPNRLLVFTDAYQDGWLPSEKPFMTGYVSFEEAGNGQTRYTAKALHWTAEDKKTHQEMGFDEGWGKAADQLEALLEQI